MQQFDPQSYGSAVAALLAGDRLCPLDAGTPNEAAHAQLRALAPAAMFDRPVTDQQAAQACLAALWLWHDFLDESHTISQSIETAEGGFWHGIMHRREGDFSNAKYWFRRVGSHPVYKQLALAAEQELASAGEAGITLGKRLMPGGKWDPYAFVDACQAARGDTEVALLQRIARREWRLLFDSCYRQAITPR